MRHLAVSLLTASAVLAGAGSAWAQAQIEVTITNLTRGQPFSPPVVASHSIRGPELFVAGEPASDALSMVAEDADNTALVELLEGDDEVADVVQGSGPIPPGGNVVIVVDAPRFFRHLSVVSMLVNSNDAFLALQGVRPPALGRATFPVAAWDAGSEINNEDCDFIPGPACEGAGAGVRDPDDAEGFVHVHAGIHGIEDAEGNVDLAPERYDWRNPVALIEIRRIRSAPPTL